LLRTLTLHGRADQVLRALVLTDRLWHVDGDGHGMAVRVPGEREVNQVDVMAPRSVEFLLGGVLPRVRVRVVEATGLPTELPGHVGVFYLELQHSLIEQDRELVHGEAVVDEVELPRDRVIPVDVLMADGEWLHRELPAIGERLQHEVGFVRGSGQAGRRLPAALALREIQNVYLEDAAGQWSGVQLGARFSFLGPNGRPEARLQDGAGSLLLSCVPQDAVRAIVVAHDGRVADFALESDGRVAGGLLPSEALAPIDTAAIYREHGAQRDGQVMLQVRIATRTGGQEWVVIRHHEMWFEGALPPTVWEGIWVPKDLPSRLVLHRHVDGRIEPGEELPLPRLGTAR
jgi:hypothetical protein